MNEFSIDFTDDITERLAGLNDIANAVVKVAVDKTSRWLQQHSIREIGSQLQLKLSPLRKRIKVFSKGQNIKKIWVGLDDISVHHFGSPIQTESGAKVGRRLLGADTFIGERNGRRMVWRRTGIMRSRSDVKKGMLPEKIERVTVSIQQLAEREVARWESRAKRKFVEFLEFEIRNKLR